MTAESPDAVRAVLEQQIKYLGDQVHRIDGEHGAIIRSIDEIRVTLRTMDDNLRAMVDDPPRFERHWEFGQAVFLAKWSDAAARAVGHRVLTVLFAAIVAAMLTWAALKGGRQ